ncbi:MAG: PAS domain-containing sensor histidine kinase, partial [Caenispirillum bisanense]|nr:PAS domain-containing sensor histidine kinase [Caenispirillum bisanense]
GGGWAWIADRGRAVDRGPDGTARRVIGVHADITALKEAEEALQEKSRALADSNRELEQFAYIASHDLQEPLRMVSSFLSLLLRREGTRLTDEGRSFAETAMDGAKRMSRLIHDLLDYSRIGTRGAAFEPVETAEAVAEALGNLKMAAADAGAMLEVQPDPPAVLGDRGQIVRLMQNLVGNALKYRAPDRPPHVRIGWSLTAPGRLHLTVADNGIGIAAEHYDTVFQIFSRLHSGSEYEGTGIGLAVCRRIVDRHGGRIWIDSVPGQGSTFHVDLPLAVAKARSTAAE